MPNDYIDRDEDVQYLVVHSSATPSHVDVGREEIRRWHMDRGFIDIGYHWLIRRDGTIEAGRPAWATGAHVRGHNRNSLGLCLIGGTDNEGEPQNNFTSAQMETLRSLLTGLSLAFPDAEIVGHRDLPDTNTSCPSFDVIEWWGD